MDGAACKAQPPQKVSAALEPDQQASKQSAFRSAVVFFGPLCSDRNQTISVYHAWRLHQTRRRTSRRTRRRTMIGDWEL